MSFLDKFRKPSGHETEAAVPTIGFWCIPVGGLYVQSFLKLPIKEQYTVDGQETISVAGDGGDPAWAIVCNAKLLSQYFEWVPSLFAEIQQSYGPFKAGSASAARTEALIDIMSAVIKNGLFCVLAEGDKAAIFGDFQPYARALVNELKGTVIQEPQNVRIGVIRSVTIATLDGKNTDAEVPIEQLLAM